MPDGALLERTESERGRARGRRLDRQRRRQRASGWRSIEHGHGHDGFRLRRAAGFFKTGQLCDYRRIGNPDSTFDPMAGGKQCLGLLYSQWLATVLQAMGVPPSDFERWGHKGYGVPFVSKESWTPPYAKHYGDTSSRYFTMASDILPFLKA